MITIMNMNMDAESIAFMLFLLKIAYTMELGILQKMVSVRDNHSYIYGMRRIFGPSFFSQPTQVSEG